MNRTPKKYKQEVLWITKNPNMKETDTPKINSEILNYLITIKEKKK